MAILLDRTVIEYSGGHLPSKGHDHTLLRTCDHSTFHLTSPRCPLMPHRRTFSFSTRPQLPGRQQIQLHIVFQAVLQAQSLDRAFVSIPYLARGRPSRLQLVSCQTPCLSCCSERSRYEQSALSVLQEPIRICDVSHPRSIMLTINWV